MKIALKFRGLYDSALTGNIHYIQYINKIL